MTTIGSIVSLSPNEKDQTKVNLALRQALERLGGKQVNASRSTTSAYTIQPTDYLIDVSGDTTLTLPSASSVPGQIFVVKKVDTGSTATIMAASASDLIDGSTSQKLTTQYDVYGLQSKSTAWDMVSKVSGATVVSTLYLQVSNNLSELTATSSSARSNIGLGTAATQNVGTSASNVVQLSTSAILPAVDGSQLTNLPVQDHFTPRTVNSQSGTTYTLVLSDAGKIIYGSTSTLAITVPPNSSVAFPVGTVIIAAAVSGFSLTAGAGVTIRFTGLSGTNFLGMLVQVATDIWHAL